jgi:hypothetical protein
MLVVFRCLPNGQPPAAQVRRAGLYRGSSKKKAREDRGSFGERSAQTQTLAHCGEAQHDEKDHLQLVLPCPSHLITS